MVQYHLGCELSYYLTQESTLILNIAVANNKRQKVIQEDRNIEPSLRGEEWVTPREKNRYFRLNAPPGNLHIGYKARVHLCADETDPATAVEYSPRDFPLALLPYLYPSRYCQSDQLFNFVMTEFGELPPGYGRVLAICDWIYHNILYLSGSSDSFTSACDTVIKRVGVCRDFAHLGITFCRALNIPARFVSGYAEGLNPPDFHAWFEAYLGDRWYRFDPTRLVPMNKLVRVGIGRDAADVSFATLFGVVEMRQMKLFMDCLPSA